VAQARPSWFETRPRARCILCHVLAMALLTMRDRESHRCKDSLHYGTSSRCITAHHLVLARNNSSELCNYPSQQCEGAERRDGARVLARHPSRTSHAGPQAFARRLASLAIGMLASRRSTRGIYGLRPSERTPLLKRRPNELTEPPRYGLQGHAQGHRITSCLS
jgi:hypothetical protein